MRVLIVGGGIGGLTAAVALRRAGLDAVVFERAPELREVGAGLTLWTNAVRVLRGLDLGPALDAVSVPVCLGELRDWRGRLLTATDLGGMADRLGAPTVGVHRADLQRLLADAVAPALTLGAACTAVVPDDKGVTVRFSDGRLERADVAVGADGLRSVVRGELLGSRKPRYAGYYAWRGVAAGRPPGLADGASVVAVGRGAQAGLVPVGGGRTYWFATANGPEGFRDPPGGAKAALLRRFAGWWPPIPAVIEATDEAAVIRSDVFDRPPARPWGAGRVTLLGDAAHPTTPNLGQGACMAIEDAVVLARCLEKAADPVTALRGYEARRYDRTAAVTDQSWRVGRLFALEGRLWCGLRDRLLRASAGWAARQTEALIGAEV